MASDRVARLVIGASVAGLMALAACMQAAYGSPRLQVLCALACVAPALLLRRAIGVLRAPAIAAEVAPGFSGDDPRRRELIDSALALEARLEHAPIALFRIAPADSGRGDARTGMRPHAGAYVSSGGGAEDGGAESGSVVEPLNASARRLVAPGRASAPQRLYDTLAAQPAGQRSLIGFDTERGVERAMVAVSALTLHGSAQRLAALMPVESELEAEALNAWRQLVHVLTHEIMNSLTPVASLSRTAHDLLDEVKADLAPDLSADLATALDAIARRAASLVDFVASYRSLSTLPQARPERMELNAAFVRLHALLAPQWQARGGRIEFSVEPATLEAMLDAGQLEQALINLLINAQEATASVAAPHAQVRARLSRGGRLRIDIADNGAGVPDAIIAHIFTPFFSTKKQGRGIGLALVRHLVHANGGTVRYARPVSGGARFVLAF